MPSVRRDIFTGSRVIVAESRGRRPISILDTPYIETPRERCPFCPGNEHMTPVGSVDKSWRTRFFPNKYPALSPEQSEPTDGVSFYGLSDGDGAHEIFIDTSSHSDNLKDFTVSHVHEIIRGLLARYIFYAADDRIKYIQIFKNKGARAGASQSHSHWQIVAGRFVPQMQETIAARLSSYNIETGKCLYCAVLENELSSGVRIIFENDNFIAFTPFASRFSYETWIVPKRHITVFSELEKQETYSLADVLCQVVPRLERIKENIDYNVLFMDSPSTIERGLFHWHIQILPKMGSLAGYEFSTGSYINHITPEKAAELLR